MRHYLPPHARTIPEVAELMFKGEIFDVYQWDQTLFDGSMARFEMLKRPDSVQVIGIVDDKVLVEDQEQPSLKRHYCFPGGRHDVSSETELQAAKRELLEETGYTFSNWKLIHVEQPHQKMEWFIYTFVAWNLDTVTEQKLDAGERIVPTLLSLQELRKLQSNEPDSAKYTDIPVLRNIKALHDLIALPGLANYE